jgi:ABC-type dipeptide/oligopeptide/nickel transport system ATPase component
MQGEVFDYYIEGLSVYYDHVHGPAVKGISMGLKKGEITAVIGESGSGKTTLAKALAGLLDPSMVIFQRARLPRRIAFVHQEAQASLHPLVPVGEQVNDCIAARSGRRPALTRENTLKLLDELGLDPAESFYRRYPYTLSGGEAQRIVLARALAMEAELVVADEPTAHLDLLSQAQAVRLLYRLTAHHGMSVCFITHDLSLVAEIATSVSVLYNGRIVEEGKVRDVWDNPRHSHTTQLLTELDGRERAS